MQEILDLGMTALGHACNVTTGDSYSKKYSISQNSSAISDMKQDGGLSVDERGWEVGAI